MLKANLILTTRRLRRHAIQNGIVILGLAIGIVSCLFLGLYIIDDVSYDRHHENGERVYRIVTDVVKGEEVVRRTAYSFPGVGPAIREAFPQVEAMARLGISDYASFVTAGDNQFVNQKLLKADSSFFELSKRFARLEFNALD